MTTLPLNYSPKTPAPFRSSKPRLAALESLTTAEIRARINALDSANADVLLREIAAADDKIRIAEEALLAARNNRSEKLNLLAGDLRECWTDAEIRAAKIKAS